MNRFLNCFYKLNLHENFYFSINRRDIEKLFSTPNKHIFVEIFQEVEPYFNLNQMSSANYFSIAEEQICLLTIQSALDKACDSKLQPDVLSECAGVFSTQGR